MPAWSSSEQECTTTRRKQPTAPSPRSKHCSPLFHVVWPAGFVSERKNQANSQSTLLPQRFSSFLLLVTYAHSGYQNTAVEPFISVALKMTMTEAREEKQINEKRVQRRIAKFEPYWKVIASTRDESREDWEKRVAFKIQSASIRCRTLLPDDWLPGKPVSRTWSRVLPTHLEVK